MRIIQVRNQSHDFSKRVRCRVKKEQETQLVKIGEKELAKYIENKKYELANLEQEYQNALHDIGMGHEGIHEQEEYEQWREDRRQQDRELAQIRGDHAINVVNYRQITEDKIKESKINLRKSIALTERLRAAEMRADKVPNIHETTVSVNTVFVDVQTKIVFNDPKHHCK